MADKKLGKLLQEWNTFSSKKKILKESPTENYLENLGSDYIKQNKKLLLEASSLSNIGATNQQIKSLYDKTESSNWKSFTLKANAKFEKVKNKKDLITGADDMVAIMLIIVIICTLYFMIGVAMILRLYNTIKLIQKEILRKKKKIFHLIER